MDKANKTILIVAAHPDDPEFRCGGTVAKYIAEGAVAYYLICTNGVEPGAVEDRILRILRVLKFGFPPRRW